MSLRVGVDAWNLPFDRRGIGRYVREILTRWASWGSRTISPTLLVPEWPPMFVRGRYLAEIGTDLPVRHRKDLRAIEIVWYPWNGVSWRASKPLVATLHDASLFHSPPQDHSIRVREQRPFHVAARLARRIITDSEFSKTELVRYLEVDPARVDVVYLGINEEFLRAGQTDPPKSQYVLFVGEPEPRKGLPLLLEALTRLPEQLRAELEVVVVGASGEYGMPPIPNSIRLRNAGWVEDKVLATLYRGAAALIYPSEYEGFGLPIIEAMAAGAPVIAADTKSSREAGGQAALYAACGNAAALTQKIQMILTDQNLVAQQRRLGFEHATDRTWNRTAEQTMAVLERSVREN